MSISPDRENITITVNVTEGPHYTVSDVRLAGELFIEEAELRRLLRIKPGDVFSRARLQASAKDISDRLGTIQTPVLVLSAADDQLVPAKEGLDLSDRLAKADWSLQPRGGHASNVTEPEDFHERVLPWLAGQAPRKE